MTETLVQPLDRAVAGLPPARRGTVFLVEDHPLVREGLQRVIEQEPDLAICGEAGDAGVAYAEIERLRPDVVLMDISLQGGESGIDLVKRLQTLPKPPRVLMLSMHDEEHYAERALRAGALGYLMKRATAGKVVEGIRQVMAGRIYVSEAIAARLANDSAGSRRKPGQTPIERLSDRELEVYRRIGQGQATRQIAEELNLSMKTVHTHCAHIKLKLGFDNATTLMLEAVRWVESGTRA